MSDTIENVLILQGGGSLGAFGCGVFKSLASSNIKLDIILQAPRLEAANSSVTQFYFHSFDHSPTTLWHQHLYQGDSSKATQSSVLQY
jgi:hypothetical protein